MIQIAQRMEENLEMLALAETWDNGKPIRETMAPISPCHRPLALLRRMPPRAEGTISELTRKPLPTTFTSRSAWSVRSFPGTSRS